MNLNWVRRFEVCMFFGTWKVGQWMDGWMDGWGFVGLEGLFEGRRV